MLKPVATPAALGLVAIVSACGTAGQVDAPTVRSAAIDASATPYLARAHSHNNYEQRQPLVDALARGFASIEVDVVLVDDDLYVAHGPDDVHPEITLRAAYLEPLHDIVGANGGTVFGAGRPPLQLLIDVKTDPDETYARLHEILGAYAGILTTWEADRRVSGAVSIVISGNRPIDRLESEAVRYAALDGRILDDRDGVSPELMPLVSEDWEKLGPPVEDARLARARRIVEEIHAEGRKVRFWGTPDDEELWRALLSMGVDYIGTDDPRRLERLLLDVDVVGWARVVVREDRPATSP